MVAREPIHVHNAVQIAFLRGASSGVSDTDDVRVGLFFDGACIDDFP